MVEMIKPYFAKFPAGDEALEDQLARYRPCVAAMDTEKSYDLAVLIDIIKNSSDEHVQAALDKKYDPNIKLHQALIAFREAVQPKTVTQPQMHYNYQTLLHAFEHL